MSRPSSSGPLHQQIFQRPALLALAIVQSADPSIPIRDYAQSLAQHLHSRSNSRTVPHPGQDCTSACLDAASYWKQRYIDSEAAQVTLRDRIHDLEVRNRALTHQLTSQPTDHDTTERPKAGFPEVGAACAAIEMGDLERELFESFPGAHFVIRELYSLRKLIRQRNTNATDLASTLIRLSTALSKALESVPGHHASSSGKSAAQASQNAGASSSSRQIETLFFAAARIRAYLMKGLDRLCKSDEGQKIRGRVIHSLIGLFNHVLKLLVTNHTRSPSKELDQSHFVCSSLARHLLAMITVLKTKLPGHDELMEGYLACFLHRTGTALGKVVFDLEPSCPDAQSAKPKDQFPELPYLTWLLHSLRPMLHGEITSVPLITRERDKLQRTMLKAVFGEAKGEYVDVLEVDFAKVKPMKLAASKEKEDSVSSFLGGVWGSVGWDVVGLEDDWDLAGYLGSDGL